MSRWTYSSLILPARLRLPVSTLTPFVFFGVNFLVIPVAAVLRGVPALDLAEEMLKWAVVPEALAIARILTIRSEIARGVGRSRPAAGTDELVKRRGGAMQEGGTYAISR